MHTLTQGKCWRCKHPFTEENVFTPAGWKEIRISSTCEACFDEIFAEGDELRELDISSPKGIVPT